MAICSEIKDSTAHDYDLIMAMSVFCRTANSDGREKAQYEFNTFEQGVRLLDGVLAPRGILSIFNSNFRFLDTDVAKGYEVAAVADIKEYVAKFDRYNNRILAIKDIVELCPFLYRKISKTNL